MSKKRVLIITQGINPYTDISELGALLEKMPHYTQNQGMEVRVLMPKFGVINERRHRLHEVVRLSGMNIIVDDDDFPLIIKVASLPGSRLQVYFLDNEEFFKRKQIFNDTDGEVFEDNPDRMVFFCKGAMETVKKFGWAPDIIHCHGWMTSLVPLYLKTVYKDEPIFQHSKVIFSAYNNDYEQYFTEQFFDKAKINDLEDEDLQTFKDGEHIRLNAGGIANADGVIVGSESPTEDVLKAIEKTEAKVLDFPGEENYMSESVAFYSNFLENEE